MRKQSKLAFGVMVAIGAGLFSWAMATPQMKPDEQRPYEQLIYSVRGPDLYRAHCAVCHGLDGKGNGPMAISLKTKPANLTVLAKANGGKFPDEWVEKFISGEDVAPIAHGTREMPVWGPIFHQIEEDQDFGNVRIQNLIKYLQAIQQK